MHPCPDCGCHVRRSDRACPHCGTRLTTVRPARTAAAALLGLAIACSGKESATTDSGDTDTLTSPDYGIPTTYSDTTDVDTDTDADSDADSDADTDSGTYGAGSGATSGVDYGSPYTSTSGGSGRSGPR